MFYCLALQSQIINLFIKTSGSVAKLDEYGKKRRHLKRGFKTKKEARLYEARLETGQLSEVLKASKQNTNISYQDLYQEWFQAYQNTVEATTAAKTKDIYRIHILPIFGHKSISNISPLECQNFITEKSKTFKNMKHIKSYTSKIFDFAINMNYIDKNPMANVIMPKIKKEKSENFWSLEELHRFLKILNCQIKLDFSCNSEKLGMVFDNSKTS